MESHAAGTVGAWARSGAGIRLGASSSGTSPLELDGYLKPEAQLQAALQ